MEKSLENSQKEKATELKKLEVQLRAEFAKETLEISQKITDKIRREMTDEKERENSSLRQIVSDLRSEMEEISSKNHTESESMRKKESQTSRDLIGAEGEIHKLQDAVKEAQR